MLQQRIITALALLAVLLPCLMASVGWPFLFFVLMFAGAGFWEWLRLNKASSMLCIGGGIAMVVGLYFGLAPVADSPTGTLAALNTASPLSPALWLTLTVFWLCFAPWMLRFGPGAWLRLPLLVRALIGAAMIGALGVALMVLKTQGLMFLLSVFALVWVADSFAYLGGRLWGQRKLAPTISPGKSWEGVLTGAVAVGLMAVAWVLTGSGTSNSLYAHLHHTWGWGGLGLALVVLVAMSVMGDLVESLVKRLAQQKDSSHLLPGHGGVLDRIDALLPVFPLVMALLTWR